MKISTKLAKAFEDLEFFKFIDSEDYGYYPTFPGIENLNKQIKELLKKEFPVPPRQPIYLAQGNHIHIIKWDGTDFTVEVQTPVEVYDERKVAIQPFDTEIELYVTEINPWIVKEEVISVEVLFSVYKEDAKPIRLDSLEKVIELEVFEQDDWWLKAKADIRKPLKLLITQ